MITEEIVLEQIKQVIDPDLGLNIVDMGLIYGVDINDDIVDITMTLTSPGCPAAPQLLNGSQTVVQQLDGVEEVNINVVFKLKKKVNLL